jgi:hypothetical protein
MSLFSINNSCDLFQLQQLAKLWRRLRLMRQRRQQPRRQEERFPRNLSKYPIEVEEIAQIRQNNRLTHSYILQDMREKQFEPTKQDDMKLTQQIKHVESMREKQKPNCQQSFEEEWYELYEYLQQQQQQQQQQTTVASSEIVQ